MPGGYSLSGSVTVPVGTNTVVQSYPSGYPSATDECGKWVGVEVINMVDITEICPDGETVTTTATETYEVLTRSICQTSTPNLPCYVCDFGLPTSDHLMTISTSSNPASPAPTPDVTVQMCSTCQTSVLSTAVLGYVPGTACHDCQPSSTAGTGGQITPMLTAEERAVETVPPSDSSSSSTSDGDGDDLDAVLMAEESSPTTATGNTPFPPPATPAPTTTAVTAGTSRNVVVQGGGLIALILGLLMAIW